MKQRNDDDIPINIRSKALTGETPVESDNFLGCLSVETVVWPTCMYTDGSFTNTAHCFPLLI
jgi:hypothetical protein